MTLASHQTGGVGVCAADAGSADDLYIKNMLYGFDGVCTDQANVKYERGALEDDSVTPGSSD